MWCTKLLISAVYFNIKKISKVVYCESYDENITEKYFIQAGIEVKKVDNLEFIYNN
jgi:hypothetical protein